MIRVPQQESAGTDREAKRALFDSLAEVAGALAAGRRAEIVDLLAQGERSVEEVAGEIGQTMANASHHLRALARTGLVRSRRAGTRIFYRLASEDVEELWSALRRAAQSVRPEVTNLASAYLGDQSAIEVIDREELMQRLAAGDIVVLDVRPLLEYRAGHISGAVSVPLADLAQRLDHLSSRQPVVAYCRGTYCVFAPAAVRALHQAGIAATMLEDGFPEWRRNGLPVSFGDEPGLLNSPLT